MTFPQEKQRTGMIYAVVVNRTLRENQYINLTIVIVSAEKITDGGLKVAHVTLT